MTIGEKQDSMGASKKSLGLAFVRGFGKLQRQWNLRLRNGGADLGLALERIKNRLKQDGLFLFAG
jgi:hypothetical protein